MTKAPEMKQLSDWPKDVDGAKGSEILNGHEQAIKVWGDICKTDNSGLTAFAYLWRRFGPPFLGSDDHKDLCGYVLTTNDPEVFLWITPSGSPLAYAIGYFASHALIAEHNKPHKIWLNKYKAKFEKWWLTQHKEFKGQLRGKKLKEVRELFWADYFDPKVQEKARPLIRLKKFEFKTTKVQKRVEKATTWAMLELLRPVHIRDVSLNIFGTFREKICRALTPETPAVVNKIVGNMVEQSPYAGYPMPKAALDAFLKERSI